MGYLEDKMIYVISFIKIRFIFIWFIVLVFVFIVLLSGNVCLFYEKKKVVLSY